MTFNYDAWKANRGSGMMTTDTTTREETQTQRDFAQAYHSAGRISASVREAVSLLTGVEQAELYAVLSSMTKYLPDRLTVRQEWLKMYLELALKKRMPGGGKKGVSPSKGTLPPGPGSRTGTYGL